MVRISEDLLYIFSLSQAACCLVSMLAVKIFNHSLHMLEVALMSVIRSLNVFKIKLITKKWKNKYFFLLHFITLVVKYLAVKELMSQLASMK